MRSGDFAYHWLIEIRHNSDPPVPGAGSAIFFHIRRGVNQADHRLHDDGAGQPCKADHLAASEATSLLCIAARRGIRKQMARLESAIAGHVARRRFIGSLKSGDRLLACR